MPRPSLRSKMSAHSSGPALSSFTTPGGRSAACSWVSKEREKAYMFGGRNLSEKCVWVYDFSTREWTPEAFGPESCNPSVIAGGFGSVINDRFYMFGGWEPGYLTHSIYLYELNLETFAWRMIVPVSTDNQPLFKNKCGVVSYGEDMLCIFGGYGFPPGMDHRLQVGARYDWEQNSRRGMGWTNEMHLFHLKKRIWVVPQVTGTPPNPCAAFTFHYIDRHRVLLFGGRQMPERVNEVHILDLAIWHWSGSILPSDPGQLWPPKRSLHTSFCLFDPLCVSIRDDKKVIPREFPWLPCPPPDLTKTSSPSSISGQKVFVLWGMDNGGDPINDSWILDVNALTWSRIVLPADFSPRTWHFSEALHLSEHECLAMTHGGHIDSVFKRSSRLSDDTLLFKFGVSSLFSLCQGAVIEMCPDLSTLQLLLPHHIFIGLCNKRELINKPTKYYIL